MQITFSTNVFTGPLLSGNSFNDTLDSATFTTTEGGTFVWATHLTTETLTADGSGGWTGNLLESGTDTVASSGESTISAAYTATTGTGGESRKFSYYIRDAAGNDSNVITESFTVNSAARASTFLYTGYVAGFSSTTTFTTGLTLAAGNYVLWIHGGGGQVLNSVTLDGQAMTAMTNGQVNQGSTVYTRTWYINSLTGGGTGNIVLTWAAGTQKVAASLVRIDTGTIDTTAIPANIAASPADLDFTFVNSANERLLVGWMSDAVWSSYDGGLVNEFAQPATVDTKYYGLGSVDVVSGSPDVVGLNVAATGGGSAGTGVRIY